MILPAGSRETIEAVLERARAQGRDLLLEHEVYQVLRAAGLDVPAFAFFASPRDVTARALEGLPGREVVVKVVSPRILHKTEFGGVRIVPKEAGAVRKALEEFQARAEREGLGEVGALACEKVDLAGGLGGELLLSLRVDRAFGPVLAFGMGGVLTEYWGKNLKGGRSLAVRSTLGMDEAEAARTVAATAAGDFLAGRTRGQEKALVQGGAAEKALLAFSRLAETFSPLSGESSWTLEEIEVNPLAVDLGGRLVALDGLGRFSKEKFASRPRPFHALKALLEPGSVLVVGASGSSMNPGRIILRNLLSSPRYSPENLYLLHPKEKEIDGVRCYAAPDDLPEGIDMAVVTIPAGEKTVDLIGDLARKGKVRTFTLITSGFGETEAGKALQEKLEETILATREREDGGVLVNGPNCLGIVSAPGDYNTFFLPPYKLAIHKGRAGGANLASVSQSGAFLVVQISRIGRFITPRYSISFGNQVDVSVSDYLRYLARDEPVQVISIYVEGFQPYDGRALLQGAREARRAGKRVILYKTGRTAAGAKAASSHTAAIAGDYAVAEQCFRQAGILVAPDLETFEEWTQAFSLLGGKEVRGRRAGVITNAGFETTVASDRLGVLELAEFAPETWERMKPGLPGGIIDFRNPVDTSPLCNTRGFLECVRAMEADPGVDCLLVSAVPCTPALENLPPGPDHEEDLYADSSFAAGLARIFEETKKPLVAVVDAGEVYDPLVQYLQDRGIPTFRKIDRAMSALSTFVEDRLER